MKHFFTLAFALCVSSLATAQELNVDVLSHDCQMVSDSLLVEITLSGSVNDLNSKDGIVLTPYISSSDAVDLPCIQINGKHRQILYTRNQDLKKRMKIESSSMCEGYVQPLAANGRFDVVYSTTVANKDWFDGSKLNIKCEVINYDDEKVVLADVFIQEIEIPQTPYNSVVDRQFEQSTSRYSAVVEGYRGSYVSPATDATDERNQRDLNFSLEEAQVMVNVNPEILSLKELFIVAMSYKDDKEKFYSIISTCVKLYPTNPVANLNAASMAIELGDVVAAKKYLQMSPYDLLEYKNCRGAYELISGNIYEGIRLLKSAKAEGSEEAAYNLNYFFEINK